MSKKILEDLRETLCKELEKIHKERDGNLGAGSLEAIHKLTDAIKNIDKIIYMKDEEYSEDGAYSYANRGQHWVRGHYSRDGGDYSSRRDRRGRYSRDDGRSQMMEHLEMALDSANEQDREDIKRFMRKLESV